MSDHKKFKLKNIEDLQTLNNDLGLNIEVDEDLAILKEKFSFDQFELPNRFVVHPMEGFDSDPNGTPLELCKRRYLRYAQGGSGLIWFEATAVLHEARSNPRQLWIHEDNIEEYKKIVDETRELARQEFGHEIVIIIQLTHSGRYSKPDGIPKPLIAHRSPILDPKHNLPEDFPILTDEYLDDLQETYVKAAKLAAYAGFDGIDVKACHRYLVSELLASHTRKGKYGGSFENRTRFLRETLGKIQTELPDLFITTRLNVYDAISHPYGWGVSKDDYRTPDLSEPIRLMQELKNMGMPLINISIGNPYFNPHYGRPFDLPIINAAVPPEHPLEGVDRFIKITRQIQEATPDLPVIASGYSWLRFLFPYVAAQVIKTGGATLIGQGRGAFAYPDSVKDIIEEGGMDRKKTCITCSMCTQIMRSGDQTGCVVKDKDIYKPSYDIARKNALAE